MKSLCFNLLGNIAAACFWGIWAMGCLVARPGWAADSTLGRPASGIFERVEPSLAEGTRALEDGRPEDALCAFRRAQTETQEE